MPSNQVSILKSNQKEVTIKSKKEIRERILTLLRSQKEEERLNKSLIICDKLFSMTEFKDSRTILFYASFEGEVDTFDMIKKAQQLGKQIGLPKVIKEEKKIIPILVESLEEDLHSGAYGIQEPASTNSKTLEIENIDMVVVPGVAFDYDNNRLGRGEGYYDRFLQEMPEEIPKVGLAFDFQIVDSLSSQEEHDIQLSAVLVN